MIWAVYFAALKRGSIQSQLTFLSCMWRKSRSFICFCPSSRCFLFYNIRLKSPKSSLPLWSQQGRVGTLCEKMIKPVFDYLINPSTLSSYTNGSMFLDPDSTNILANEINFITPRSRLLQIKANWKLPISDQPIWHPKLVALSNMVSSSICVSDHESKLGAPETLSCFPSCWEMSYLSDLFSLIKPVEATHSTPGYIIFLACSIILEILVIKDKNSWVFFELKNDKKSGPFFDPLPFRLHAAFYSHLDILAIGIILVFFLVLLFFKDWCLMKCFLKNNWKKIFQNVLYIELNTFLCIFY